VALDLLSRTSVILPRLARLSTARRALTAASVWVTLLFGLSRAATVEAAQALLTTDVSGAIIGGLERAGGDERSLFAGEPHRAIPDPAGDESPALPAAEPHTPLAPKSDHMFGVLPNYSTVEDGTIAPRLTTRQTFQMAALSSFDPYVFPFVGVVAAINPAPGQSYPQRYATSLADNAIGNFLTSAVMPLVLGQDPRYFESGHGSIARRAWYAASRSVMTRGRSGHPQFNVSELAGNAIAAGVSNLYYTPAERTITGTLSRWGMQVLWDTLSNEMKEFWPDIRHRLHHE
jgi:hypothetical protein